MSQPQKIVVVGAGIGGLTAAALLAQAGLDVTVLETNTYPGGSAGTFFHKGYRFDAGATVAGGFHADGPHALLGERLGVTWPVRPADPAWIVHLPDRKVAFGRDRTDLLAHFPQSESFWREQERVADLAWSLAAAGLPWPPASAAELGALMRAGFTHLPGALRLLPFLSGTTSRWLARHGLADEREFVRMLDAQLLISVQTTTPYANPLYSATALDLARKGTFHVEGGMGVLAQTLVGKITDFGGRVIYRRQVTGFDLRHGRVRGLFVRSGKRSSETVWLPADAVIANLTPATLDRLLGDKPGVQAGSEVAQSSKAWGAFVLHLGLNQAKLPLMSSDHHQIVTDMDSPLGEGRSLFLSLSPLWDKSRAPAGHRAATVSTHTDVSLWWYLLRRDPQAYEERKQAYADRLLKAIDKHLPGFRRSVTLTLPGTPVTYERYTGRLGGRVGGSPQTSLFQARGPRTTIPNLRIVGDSIFPGQSTAAVTLGAMRVASDLLDSLEGSLPLPERSRILDPLVGALPGTTSSTDR